MCWTVVQNNAEDNVTWIHSYVSDERKEDLLRLRRAVAGSHSAHVQTEQPADRSHH
jgi:hypothetical protein